MSVKLYCPNCYVANEYSNRPPKFCGECGQPFTESSASLPSQNKVTTKPAPAPARTPQPLPNRLTKLKTRRAQIEEDYDENLEENIDQDDIIAPEIDKLEVEIQNNLRPNTNSFKDIAATIKPGERKKRGRPVGKNLSKSQIEKNWAAKFPKNERHEVSE